MMQQPLRVALYGLGAIGSDIARLIHQQPHLQLVGGIDTDPAKVGQDLGAVLGLDQPLGILVQRNPTEALRQARPDVVVIATTSYLRDVFPQIHDGLNAGAHVISTCEELVYPVATHPEVAHELDLAAQKAHRAVLGIGINPGFVMDMLPILLTAPSTAIRHVRVTRVVDASTRRASLQQRIGAGLDAVAFRDLLRQNKTRHIGLQNSLYMIADALNWQLDRVTEVAEPLLADMWLRTECVTVAPGQVAGVHQTARGFIGSREVIQLDWRTAVGMAGSHDAIMIDGTPPIDLVIRGGIHGDQAAAALVMRAASTVTHLAPGLRTVLDLPVLHYTSPRLRPPVLYYPPLRHAH